MTEPKLYRVKATGTIVMACGPGVYVGFDDEVFGSYAPADLEPVVAVPPNRVLPEGLEVVDTSGLVRRDGGPMPVVVKLPEPAVYGQTMVAIYKHDAVYRLYPTFLVSPNKDHDYDLILKPPKPKYRPFANRDEAKHLWGERVRLAGDEHLVYFVLDDDVSLSDGTAAFDMNYDELLESATMLDGTPCGVREEG